MGSVPRVADDDEVIIPSSTMRVGDVEGMLKGLHDSPSSANAFNASSYGSPLRPEKGKKGAGNKARRSSVSMMRENIMRKESVTSMGGDNRPSLAGFQPSGKSRRSSMVRRMHVCPCACC